MPEFAEPLWLVGIVLVFIGARYHGAGTYFIRKASYKKRGEGVRQNYRITLPRIFFEGALYTFLILLAQPVHTFTTVEHEVPSSRTFITVDNSSSMIMWEKEEVYCSTKDIDVTQKRVAMACRALHRLIDDVHAFSEQQKEDAVHLVGVLRFARSSLVHSYPTDDYPWLRKRVNEMGWIHDAGRRLDSASTNLSEAVWDMFLLAFERNREVKKKEELASISTEDLELLKLALEPNPEGVPDEFVLPIEWEEKIKKLQGEMRDTSFIVVTDAQFSPARNSKYEPVSFAKLAGFANALGIPMYIISIDIDNAEYKELVQETGFGPRGGKYRGDLFVIDHGTETQLASIEKLVSTILKRRFEHTVPVVVERRRSYTFELGFLLLTLVVLGILCEQTLSRSLTE